MKVFELMAKLANCNAGADVWVSHFETTELNRLTGVQVESSDEMSVNLVVSEFDGDE